ncbi:MAG: hypothetical protein DME62_13010 [Verrucomicrobia bacterium]|nr:MAG: hypothetical protein DME62_13010 [Verrucomicrobiota bacterium]
MIRGSVCFKCKIMRGVHRVSLARTTLEDLSKDDVVRLAIERALEVIGEAANRFPAEFRAKYPDVEWRKIIGMRNVLIHGYDIVQSDVLWDTVQESLPTLLNQIEQMLRDLEKP